MTDAATPLEPGPYVVSGACPECKRSVYVPIELDIRLTVDSAEGLCAR
jgi:hypothetical protein